MYEEEKVVFSHTMRYDNGISHPYELNAANLDGKQLKICKIRPCSPCIGDYSLISLIVHIEYVIKIKSEENNRTQYKNEWGIGVSRAGWILLCVSLWFWGVWQYNSVTIV